eukprot:TRINITY_DN20523_c1_g1_i1.p1 TRINITY_DN20523_c1_g1~~TRINITY_DN20523_c1_g1_i1.p1  ORF type:complete len:462 (+),score=93.52 TRINITY_DN20523_c1_g1_i1:143-1528(+)
MAIEPCLSQFKHHNPVQHGPWTSPQRLAPLVTTATATRAITAATKTAVFFPTATATTTATAIATATATATARPRYWKEDKRKWHCTMKSSYRNGGTLWSSLKIRLRQTNWQLGIAFVGVAMLVACVTHVIGTGLSELFPRESLWQRDFRRFFSGGSRRRGIGSRIAAFFGSGDGAILIGALAICALAAMGRARRSQKFTPAVRGRRRSRRQRPVTATGPSPSVEVMLSLPSAKEKKEMEAEEAFRSLRTLVEQGEELRSTLALEQWSKGPHRPLKRSELRLLLEEASRKGQQLTLMQVLMENLQSTGVNLDWSPKNNCFENFGRYVLDASIEAAVNENQNEKVALCLIDFGLKSGNGDASQLNSNPLLRTAAGLGMVQLAEKLVKDCRADLNSPDPRFGSTALDRAVGAGHDKVADKLLALGADPAAGRGVDYILARIGPKARNRLLSAKFDNGEATTASD